MASSKEYLEFILEQLSGLEDITYRAMMGDVRTEHFTYLSKDKWKEVN